jgi:hypothetical protein
MTTRTFQIPKQVMTRQVGEELVLLELASGTYFGLDPVGARIWELLSEGHSVDDICATMQSEYDAAADVLMQDVLNLVETLTSKGLIQAQGQSDSSSQN